MQAGLSHVQVADPDGYFKSGSAAAEAAKARVQKAMQHEKQQKEAQERRKREKLVRKAQSNITHAAWAFLSFSALGCKFPDSAWTYVCL